MGVLGAAVATIIGQFCAATLAVILFLKQSPVKIKRHHLKLNFKLISDLYKVALPSGVMMSLPSILVSILNGILASVSQAGIAFFGIYYILQTFVNMPVTGIIQGMRPIPSILVSILNGILASVSQAGIAFFGIYYILQTFVNMPVTGIIQGMRPIVSYNHGAELKDRVLKTIKYAMIFSAVILVSGTIAFTEY